MEKINIAGVKVSVTTPGELNGEIDRLATRGGQGYVLSANVHSLNLCRVHSWLAAFYNSADIVRVDGAGVVLAARILGHRIPPRITWIDWGWLLAEHLARNGRSLYLLGGPPSAAARTAQALIGHAPGLKILGTHHGYFDKQGRENQTVIAGINALEPDILVVGMGMPLQEKWILENHKHIKARVFVTSGAAFELFSGMLRRCPRWMADRGLNWLFRLCQDPRRLAERYLSGNLRFMLNVLRQRIQRS